MPDITAGKRLLALDFTPTVEDTQNDAYSTTDTSFGVGTSAGTYNDCGVAFIACTTGRAKVQFAGRLQHATDGAATEMAPYVREGSTVGSGADVVVASTDNKIRFTAAAAAASGRMGATLLLEGLTPGDTYNVRLEHRVTGGTGTLASRHVVVSPAT